MNEPIHFLNIEFIFGKIFNFFYNLWEWIQGDSLGAGDTDTVNFSRLYGRDTSGSLQNSSAYQDLYGDTSIFTRPLLENSESKLFFFLFIVLLIILIVFLALKLKHIQIEESQKYHSYFIRPAVQERKNMRWEKIRALFQSPNEGDWRIAIIESDAMLEEMVAHLGYEGDTLAERLKKIETADFPTLQQAWQAHIVRNRIAHEGLEYHLTKDEALRTYRLFESVFRDAGYI